MYLYKCLPYFFAVLILQALDESIRNKSPFKLINSFQKDTRELKQMLLDKNTIVCETAAEILTFLGTLIIVGC